MAAQHRASQLPGKHRAQRSVGTAAQRESGGLRGRRRRTSTWGTFVGWLGFGRRAAQERAILDGHLRELRLATATLRAEISVLRLELDQAVALAAERRVETARIAMLLPLVSQAFAAAGGRREPIYVDYSPDVAQLAAKRPAFIDLEPARSGPDQISADVQAAAATQRKAAASAGAHRRTA